MAKARTDTEETRADEAAPKIMAVRFLKTWASDRGYFAEGSTAELPAELAKSLIAEKAAE